MAYIDILSSNTANVAHLDITDFGLATANDVSNIVVVLNVYNTATANSWDNEAYLINNGVPITSNYASNVFHSNTSSSERAFVFNANTFTKLEIESQSFGFRYKPQSDGSVRVYVGNVRVRINNSQPANGITSYVQQRELIEDVTSSHTRKNDISLIRSLSTRITSTLVKAVSSIKTSITGITSSVVSSIIGGIQEVLLTCSVGLNNAHTKNISLIKAIVSNVNISAVKNTQIFKTSITTIGINIKKDISAIRNTLIKPNSSIIKAIQVFKSSTVKVQVTLLRSFVLLLQTIISAKTTIVKNIQVIKSSIANLEANINKNVFAVHIAITAVSTSLVKSVHKIILVNVQSVSELIQSKLMKLVLTLQIGIESGLTKTINKFINGFVSLQVSIEKTIDKVLSIDILPSITSTLSKISGTIQNIIVPASRMMLVKARDLYERISKRDFIHPIRKRDNTEKI